MTTLDPDLCQCKSEGCMCVLHKTDDENGLCLPCRLDMHLKKNRK